MPDPPRGPVRACLFGRCQGTLQGVSHLPPFQGRYFLVTGLAPRRSRGIVVLRMRIRDLQLVLVSLCPLQQVSGFRLAAMKALEGVGEVGQDQSTFVDRECHALYSILLSEILPKSSIFFGRRRAVPPKASTGYDSGSEQGTRNERARFVPSSHSGQPPYWSAVESARQGRPQCLSSASQTHFRRGERGFSGGQGNRVSRCRQLIKDFQN